MTASVSPGPSSLRVESTCARHVVLLWIDAVHMPEVWLHHRVGIARQRGMASIDAQVTEIHTPYELAPDVDVAVLVHMEQARSVGQGPRPALPYCGACKPRALAGAARGTHR